MRQFIIIFQVVIAITLLQMANTSGPGFPSELFHQVSKVNPTNNIIISPVSIQTCLALGYFGAAGKTAEEMSTGLHLGTNNREHVASYFEKMSNSAKGLVKIANKLYANNMYEIKPEFNNVALKSFQSKTENIDFSKSTESIKKINDWVADNTNHKIQNLLATGSVNGETKMILVNAIHFKGEWVYPFSNYSTLQSDFWTSEKNKVTVSMMNNADPYKYGDFKELDATAIEMPYKNSELSMMIILPNKRSGLNDLLSKIKNKNFIELANKMTNDDVKVTLPKFKNEFEIELKNVLQSMGMNAMFSNNADFSNLFKTKSPVTVSDVVHKAFVEVNEAGTEAAAATYMKIEPRSMNMNQKRFRVDHPFMYLIKDKTNVYFVGQVVKF